MAPGRALSKHFDGKEIIVKLRDLLLLAGGVAAASQASALSLGNSQGTVQLGSPLDLVFHVHPDAGQTAQSSCISAEVWMGDAALGSSQVQLSTQAKTVRVRTTAPVYEPLITLKLNAGCEGSMSRSYTFFADPPSAMAASVQPIDLSKIQVSPLPAPQRSRAAPAAPAEKPVRVAKRAVNPKAVQLAAADVNAVAAGPAPLMAAADEAKNREAAPAVATPLTAAPAPAEKPRLKMEALEGFDTAPVIAPPTDTADSNTATPLPSAVIDPHTQLLLDANASRFEAMEQQLKTLQQQLSRNRTEMSGMQTQLAQAQNPEIPVWVHLMLGLLALALATIAWLIQRIKHERLQAQRSWADTVLAVEDSERATTIDTRAPVANPWNAQSATTSEAGAITQSPSASAATRPAAPHATAAVTTSNEEEPALYQEFEQLQSGLPAQPSAPTMAEVLTAQALFDVQEQAEFYASIGENDQAIAILQSHIAEHEASSPLAYIELLQLLYRLSRTDAYEDVREKFQTHFNVQVPGFLGFSRKGRDLWSGHPDVLSRIEAHWPTDEVQDLLRSLILRHTNPSAAATQARFDLSAFDDLLMLYNVAKTTPAASRGQLPGRVRTSPTEAPLPEVVFDDAATAPVSTYQATSTVPVLPVSPPLPFAEASLDLLSAAPAQAPLSAPTPYTGSPFQTASHFAPDEALIDGLSLEWGAAAPVPEPPKVNSLLALDELDAELQAFMMDERDLPKDHRAGQAS